MNVRPSHSGKRAMSRGKLIIDAVFVTGSTDTTIRVSLRAWLRPSDESIPVSRMLIRELDVGGVDTGVADSSSAMSLEVAVGTCWLSWFEVTKIDAPAS